jgi:hypothetical protein
VEQPENSMKLLIVQLKKPVTGFLIVLTGGKFQDMMKNGWKEKERK